MQTGKGQQLVYFEPDSTQITTNQYPMMQSRFYGIQQQANTNDFSNNYLQYDQYQQDSNTPSITPSPSPLIRNDSSTNPNRRQSFWNKRKLTTPINYKEYQQNNDAIDPFNFQVHHEHNKKGRYNGLQMPCDWELAKNHALARTTAPGLAIGGKNKTCPCCGFSIQKVYVDYWVDASQLSFLGPGFPLFYNFVKYCILILTVQFTVKGLFNLITNLRGDYCQLLRLMSETLTNCPNSFLLTASLANKLKQFCQFNKYVYSRMDQIKIMQILNLISIFINMIILQFFRRSQRYMTIDVDEAHLTPSDYTIQVKNIPIGLDTDYKAQIKDIFENKAVLDSDHPIVVQKIVLVYDISEIIEMEQDLQDLVAKKQKQVLKYKHNYNNPVVRLIDKEIQAIQHVMHFIEEDIQKNPEKFVGMAFVSFQNEAQKDKVLHSNKHSIQERFLSFIQRGLTPNISDEDLSWNGQKLFVEQAPEPNSIDWEFIHIGTLEKIIGRIKALIKTIVFEIFCFIFVYLISLNLAEQVDIAYSQQLNGKIQSGTEIKIIIICQIIAFCIVIFNKFGVGKILHYIVDEEKRSNKTEFQISYAKKYSICLFLNAAIISYNNVIGYGGFIYNETLVFILNATLAPAIWLIDPWSIGKNYIRTKELQKMQKSVLTQDQANALMEDPDYLSAKRYSDIMKTMWFSFFYATAIPLGLILSLVGLVLYYLIDKYNLLRRRTVKENISHELSEQMIISLEYILLFSPLGEMSFSWALYKQISIYDMGLTIFAVLYLFVLPIDRINRLFFPRVSLEEPVDYNIGKFQFSTDYDRENPVTKSEAIEEWEQELKQRKREGKNNEQT